MPRSELVRLDNYFCSEFGDLLAEALSNAITNQELRQGPPRPLRL
jgi:hypothetical protein